MERTYDQSCQQALSLVIVLNFVAVAKAVVEGGPDLFIRTGSSINLTCEISRSPEPPHFVFWYHNDRMINYVSAKGEIRLHKGGPDSTVSRLYIRKAVSLDSGNYTCDPANAEPVSISVHVVNGELSLNKVAILRGSF